MTAIHQCVVICVAKAICDEVGIKFHSNETFTNQIQDYLIEKGAKKGKM